MGHTWTLWSVDVHEIICVRSDERISESWTFLKLLQIHNRERLCLKPLPQFSSHPNETCYIKSLRRVDVHHILVWGLTQRFQSYAPFLKFKHIHNREFVSQSSSIVIKMIFFICWLIFCDKKGIRGIFITMNGSSLFLTSKPIFQNSYLQFTQQAFGNGWWYSKTA